MIQTRYIPKGATMTETPLGVVYTYESAGRLYAIGYHGRACKPDFHYSYRSAESRAEAIARFFAGLEKHEANKKQRAAERTKAHTLPVNAILHHSWGWEQTQCDFYVIVRVTPHGAYIRPIADETVEGSTISHGMADMRQPKIPIECVGPERFVYISGYNSVGLEHGSAHLWDGKPQYCSWYA
jgi:hypothetical protein